MRLGRTAIGGLGKAAGAMGRLALDTGRLAGKLANVVGRAAAGALEAGKLAASGRFGSAWSKIKETAKKAGGDAIAIGQAWLKATAAAGGAALDGLVTWATGGVWGEIKDDIKRELESRVKKVLGGQVMKWVASNVPKILEKVAGILGEGRVADALGALRAVMSAAEKVQAVIRAVSNPQEVLRRGRDWALDQLADLAMRVLDAPVRKVAGALMGAALSLLKQVVSIPLTAMVTSAVAAASLGIGAATAPAIWFLINKLLDFAIGQIQGALANLALSNQAIRGFIRGKVLRPLLDPLYNRLAASVGGR